MDKSTIKEKVNRIASKRDYLLELLETPDIGTLRVDIDQALEELDELLEEYTETFPEEPKSF